MNNFNVGLLGAGRVAQIHLSHLKRMENVKVKAICDILAEDSWKESYGVEVVTKDIQVLLKDPDINVIFICTPTETHAELTIQAAKAGKHIFCEKPVGIKEEEILEAYRVVQESKVKFQTGFNRRFDRNHGQLENLVRENTVGKPQVLKITSRDPQPPALEYVKRSGGLFMDMMIHDFDMARFLMGEEVEEVFAYGGNLIDPEIGKVGDIDTAVVSLKFKNGSLGLIDNSRRAVYGYDQRIEVFGEKGMVQSLNELENSLLTSSQTASSLAKPKFFFLERYQNAFLSEIQSFFKSLEEDKETKCSFKDGIMAIRIAKAAKESLDSGKAVKVNLTL